MDEEITRLQMWREFWQNMKIIFCLGLSSSSVQFILCLVVKGSPPILILYIDINYYISLLTEGADEVRMTNK